MLAGATVNVLEQFDLKPDPKTQAIIGLVMACGTVYGPRAYLFQARRAAEKAARKAGPDGVGVASVVNPDGSTATTEFQTSRPN